MMWMLLCRVECESCHRKFAPKSIEKHQKICRKSVANSAKRGTFKQAKPKWPVEEPSSSESPAKDPAAKESGLEVQLNEAAQQGEVCM